MKIAKTGKIQDFCQPNALLTLQEYVQVGRGPSSCPDSCVMGQIEHRTLPTAVPLMHKAQRTTQDYASPETRAVAERVIARESQNMSPHAQQAYERKRKQILEGKRDLYF